MNCPHCNNDLSELENFDNIYQNHNCTKCEMSVYLDYDEVYIEEDNDCWEIWTWIKSNENLK